MRRFLFFSTGGMFKRMTIGSGEVRKLSGFSEFGIVSVPPGDTVAF